MISMHPIVLNSRPLASLLEIMDVVTLQSLLHITVSEAVATVKEGWQANTKQATQVPFAYPLWKDGIWQVRAHLLQKQEPRHMVTYV